MKSTTDSSDKLVVVKSFSTLWEAQIAMSQLEQQEIPAMLTNENFSSIYPIGFNSVGEVSIMVFERDLERARRAVAHCSSSGI